MTVVSEASRRNDCFDFKVNYFRLVISHEYFMQRCLQLAEKGIGLVSPNPMVGCVIALNNEIIGEGYHKAYGKPHAEVNAINSVEDKSLLANATLYVNLEPCAHHGKTPPCADLIVKMRIPRVVIACRDPHELVAGKGVQKLLDAGVAVVEHILEEEALHLNRRFISSCTKSRPYVILKWAQTQDGFLDVKRNNGEKGIAWITNPTTKKLVHLWRSQEAAVMVGRNTIANDNPRLTVRELEGKNPIRIVLDSQLQLKNHFHVFNDESPTYIFNELKDGTLDSGTRLLKVDNMKSFPKNILDALHALKIQSVLVEGGAEVLGSFLDSGLWDEARVLVGQKIFEQGLKAPQIKSQPQSTYFFSNDEVKIYMR